MQTRKEISGGTVEDFVNLANTLSFQLGRYAMTPPNERDESDHGLVNQLRVAVSGIMAQCDQIARMPQAMVMTAAPVPPPAPNGTPDSC